MRRPVTIIGAPSSIGIRPYDQSGEARHLDRAPRVLRELGLVARLDADDLGDVAPPPYPPGELLEHVPRPASPTLTVTIADTTTC